MMMKHRWMAAATFAAVVAANGAVNEVRQIFRAERFQRGDTNVSRLPIRRSVVARRLVSGGAIYRSFCIPFGAGGALQSDGGWCILPPHLHMGGVIPPCTKHDKDKNENETRK